MSRKTITTRDLLTAHSNGFGFLAHPVRQPSFWAEQGLADPYSAAQGIDEAVVDACNKAKLTPEQFAAFVDSRAGRHLGDTLTYDFPTEAKRGKAIAKILAGFLRA